MGLWDLAKGAGKGMLNQMQKQQEEILRYKERMEYADDETVKRAFRCGKGTEKYAAGLVLKERGYTKDDLDL